MDQVEKSLRALYLELPERVADDHASIVRARIADLEAKLAASESKCAELDAFITATQTRLCAVIESRDASLAAALARAEEAEAEVEKWKRVAVWACDEFLGESLLGRPIYDSTTEETYRALREAMGASEGSDESGQDDDV